MIGTSESTWTRRRWYFRIAPPRFRRRLTASHLVEGADWASFSHSTVPLSRSLTWSVSVVCIRPKIPAPISICELVTRCLFHADPLSLSHFHSLSRSAAVDSQLIQSWFLRSRCRGGWFPPKASARVLVELLALSLELVSASCKGRIVEVWVVSCVELERIWRWSWWGRGDWITCTEGVSFFVDLRCFLVTVSCFFFCY